MATRISRQLAAGTLRQFIRRDISEFTLRSRHRATTFGARRLHTSQTRASNHAPETQSAETSPRSRQPIQARTAPFGVLLGGGLLASMIAYNHLGDDTPDFQDAPSLPKDDRDPSLPRFRLADIRKHDASSPQPWVIFEDKVYDITDWVSAHPGGDVILRAAGGSIEPYWNIFTIHKSKHVREILDQYLIGFIDVADLGPDGRPPAESIEDPFKQDPERDPRFIIHTAKPRNAEPPNEELDRSFLTPNELFYIRHHMWVPVVEEAKAEEHCLTIELPDGEVKKYTLRDLKEKFPTHKVTAALQCSGNRRNDMTRHAGKTNGLQWGVGAISNAVWEGVRLSDVLADAGLKVRDATSPTRTSNPTQSPSSGDEVVDSNSMHVQFTGLEAYGASIPLHKAIDPRGDVLLAFGMNGKPLPRDHGFPLRAVVPGHVAARSVKWLSKIVVSDEESTSQWQRRDYKSFGPNEGPNPNWDRAPAIQEMPVTSAITGVWVGECVRKGRVPWMRQAAQTITNGNGNTASRSGSGSGSGITDIAAVSNKSIGFTATASSDPCPDSISAEPVALQGYAYSGGGRAIARVDVSLDGGKTWDQAELVDDCASPSSGPCYGNKTWSWKRWRYVGKLPTLEVATGGEKDGEQKKACATLVVKATDDAYNTQPADHKAIYNVRGNLATAWHRVKVCPRCMGAEKSTGPAGEERTGGVRWETGAVYGCGFDKEEEGEGKE
ncbi:hypothetical protein VTJ04DRAFT_7304 [Mycothermus thermophilus]|uniref:uncharacterized protein n=1 Tax=Humicola insolens TaxID=85995 RepID=UPI003743EF8E